MARTFLIALLVAALAAVSTTAEDKKPARETIQGAWKATSAKETAGFKDNVDIDEYKDSVWTFTDKEIVITTKTAQTKLSYTLDPTKKPKQIDLGKNENRKLEGIYELDGDKLRICYTVYNIRPTDFSMGKGIAAIKRLIVLERQKK